MSEDYKSYEDMSNDELLKEYNEIYDEHQKSGLVHSLTDFEEIVRELTLREG